MVAWRRVFVHRLSMLYKRVFKIIDEIDNLMEYLFIGSALLSKLSGQSGQNELIVGTPVAGRAQADSSRVIGMFVKMPALRT
ncbi:hypothetical protein I9X38_05665 [Bacillus mojavensis]|nr:hypothetical protein I9X38_05665 [Bacillus mojavensis]